MHTICDACETVRHCSQHGCIPVTSAQHTPGPWTNHGRIAQPGLPHSAVAAKTLIARVYSEAFGDSAQETANGDLIAASPDLLASCKRLLREMECEVARRPNVKTDEVRVAIDHARAAITKATGSATS